ncbi:MAG: hypothetical protein HYS13_16355 [Planctomycetia bacterium]|nr:hypothetical protein [Planctomycetia bacterium]
MSRQMRLFVIAVALSESPLVAPGTTKKLLDDLALRKVVYQRLMLHYEIGDADSRGCSHEPLVAAWRDYMTHGESGPHFRGALLQVLVATHEELGDKACSGKSLCPPGTLASLSDPATQERIARRLTIHRLKGHASDEEFPKIWDGFVAAGETEEAFREALRVLKK